MSCARTTNLCDLPPLPARLTSRHPPVECDELARTEFSCHCFAAHLTCSTGERWRRVASADTEPSTEPSTGPPRHGAASESTTLSVSART